MRTPALALVLLGVLLASPSVAAPGAARVVFEPAELRLGEVGWVHVRGVPAGATVAGVVASRPLGFFPRAGGLSAIVGVDLETTVGSQPWKITVTEPASPPRAMNGTVRIVPREFPVQRLTLPESMVDLDPEIERRVASEIEKLRSVYRTVTPVRLWWGTFVRPVGGEAPGTGFGARRIINGKPRMPHTGIDFSGRLGTAVLAANAGRVALVGEFFFPGRLVVIDHGLGLHTLYFHLDTIRVGEAQEVERGQLIGTVGATGRATGPHLHFGAQVGPARVDPAALLRLSE